MPGTVTDGPTVSMSFANNFWGKEDAGVQPLLERMHNAKVTCDELKSFYNTRASIEDDYARKMTALCRKPLGSSEAGTLRSSLDVMRGEVESMGKSHQAIAAQMKSELEEPLAAFAGGMKERRKIVQNGVEKLFKVKQQQTHTVNKARDRYEQDCLKIKGYLAQGHMVMGQEERKNKAKMEKTQIQMSATSNEYEAAIKALEETTGRWNRDWKSACDKFQDLEEERLDFMKSSLWTFANVASTVCVSDDASCEKIRLSLEGCEVEKDIASFIQERGTGQEIPDPPKYINFCRGDLNDNASEASEDENYSVAQFQRTINPAFRSSSPQPSTFESHHDPQSDLAVRMGHMESNTPPSRETTMTPQKATQKPPPIIDYRKQSQTQAPYQHKVDELATVPHNEYPADGMTMFCRTAPPSDQSSAASPVRPSSRDSQSEYSNPTSFSSQEPASGKQSPMKQDTDEINSAMSPNKQLQKKRSGFFSNSPFRRKSKHEKEGPAITTPTARNTWGSSNSRYGESNNSSPTRPYGRGRNSREAYSGSPEPVDPRANFQLNVGPNVFDVASPEPNRSRPAPRNMNSPQKELDPIAAALAELKGVNKQSSVRMSADRYAGVATPGPASASGTQSSDISAAQRGTPPPSYHDQPIRRLDAPQPAFTSAAMQQTTRKYVGQNQDMYGSSRSGTRGAASEMPRATSPRPMRSTSPRPGYDSRSQPSYPRAASPNPYGNGGRQRQAPNASPTKPVYSKRNSPNDIRRSASPQPQFTRQERPNSSAGDMSLQLAPGVRDGSGQRNRSGAANGRPMTYYGGQPPQHHSAQNSAIGRTRSKSMADGRQYTKDGRPILHQARALYLYRAAIPEELSFAKGDILAVLRLQDDGWWEAEVTGKKGRPGLVPILPIFGGRDREHKMSFGDLEVRNHFKNASTRQRVSKHSDSLNVGPKHGMWTRSAAEPLSSRALKSRMDTEIQDTPSLVILPKDPSPEATICTLAHPRTSSPCRYFFDPSKGVYEFTRVAAPKSSCRSWLLTGETNPKEEDKEVEKNAGVSAAESEDVPYREASAIENQNAGQTSQRPISDGYAIKNAGLLIATPIDLLFLLLPSFCNTMSVKSPASKRLFLSADDLLEKLCDDSEHFTMLSGHESTRKDMEARMQVVCDMVDAGDEKMYRLNEEKLLQELVHKAERMVAKEWPPSLEEKFVSTALETPVLGLKREESSLSDADPSKTKPQVLEPVSLNTIECQASTASIESTTSNVSADTEVTVPEDISSTTDDRPLFHLLRVRTALSYMISTYVPIQIATSVNIIMASEKSPVDFAQLDQRLAAIAKMRADAVASRSLGDFSRKRSMYEEDEAAETRAEKKRKKEEEEKKKKNGEPRSIRDLKKVDTKGMKKMSDFFSKGAAVKKK